MTNHIALHTGAVISVILGLILLLLSIPRFRRGSALGAGGQLSQRQFVVFLGAGMVMMGVGHLMEFGPHDAAGTLLGLAGSIVTVGATVRYWLSLKAGKPAV